MLRFFTDCFSHEVRLCRLRIAMLDEAIGLTEQDSSIKNVNDSDVESGTDEADLARKSEYLKRLAGTGF